jgi:hypothetical protein
MPTSLRRALAASCLALLVFASPRAWAWGNTGHEAVAYVAWQNMTPSTRARAIQLIKLIPTLTDPKNPASTIDGYAEFVKELPDGLTQDQQNEYLFMRAATWPDSIKHKWLVDSDNPPHGNPATDSNIGFNDTHSHGYWHFVDNNFSSDGSTAPPLAVPNAQTQIIAFRDYIASGEPDILEAYDMIWLEHMVGDIHQPLHAAARFSKGDTGKDGDEGGNTIMIKLPLPMEKEFERNGESKYAPTELHGFWDSLPGEGNAQEIQFAVTFAAPLSPAPATAVADTNVADWNAESLAMARADVYASPIGDGPGPVVPTVIATAPKAMPAKAAPRTAPTAADLMTDAYYQTALADAQARIALAGARLAALLNDNLK